MFQGKTDISVWCHPHPGLHLSTLFYIADPNSEIKGMQGFDGVEREQRAHVARLWP